MVQEQGHTCTFPATTSPRIHTEAPALLWPSTSCCFLQARVLGSYLDQLLTTPAVLPYMDKHPQPRPRVDPYLHMKTWEAESEH